MRLPPRIPKEPRGVKAAEPDVERTRISHLTFVRNLPCASCWKPAPNDAHHLLGAEYGKSMGKKAFDRHTIPLCRRCHDEYHNRNRSLLIDKGIDERDLAKRLFFISEKRDRDIDMGRRSVQRARNINKDG